MHRIRYLVGLLTLALAVGGTWVLLRWLRAGEERPGLQLRVEFRDARGLRGGADVRYRGVTVGTVRSVQIGEDGHKAVANLVLDPIGARQAAVNSAFWIVSPRFAGLTGGASGLDTLVRDTYVAFVTQDPRGTELVHGSLIAGSERPPANVEPESLEPIEHGDLLMSVLVPENHGLKPGSAVIFRGTQTGDVRAVELASDGSHVQVRLRVARRFRATVTDKSVFWIARPHLSGALFSGFTVSDVGSLLSPFVNYWTEPGQGLPAEDGLRVAAVASRPEVRIPEVPAAALQSAQPAPAVGGDPLVLVRVIYAAQEEDTFSANDAIRREGTGVLFLDASGRPVVVTARSLVDGAWTEEDTFGGDPEIIDEHIKVVVPQGPVLRAGRVWTAPGDRDLAALVLEDAPPDLRSTPAILLDFAIEPTAGRVHALQPDGLAAPAQEATAPPTDVAAVRGAALVHDGRVGAICGQASGHDATPAWTPLALLPVDLRPGN